MRGEVKGAKAGERSNEVKVCTGKGKAHTFRQIIVIKAKASKRQNEKHGFAAFLLYRPNDGRPHKETLAHHYHSSRSERDKIPEGPSPRIEQSRKCPRRMTARRPLGIEGVCATLMS
jgi:hypothetical protein